VKRCSVIKRLTHINIGRLPRSVRVRAAILSVSIVLNVTAWHSSPFCSWYLQNVFPLWVNTYARLSGMADFSVGEVMIYSAVLLILVYTAAGIFRLVMYIRHDAGFKKVWHRMLDIGSWIVVTVILVMTLNCYIIYHCPSFMQMYHVGNTKNRYTQEEKAEHIAVLRNYIVRKADSLSDEFERDSDGYIIYNGDMKAQAKYEMKRLGRKYGQLGGYYPDPKGLVTSDFFSQQYMMGYYFPFSMEANYNTTMYITNRPCTMCHELSHLKGFIYEDEANFIGYIACTGSDDKLFQYSGYLSVLSYVDRDFYKSIGRDKAKYRTYPAISRQVKKDNIFLTSEAWSRVDSHALFKTEHVKKVSGAAVNTSLRTNGVSDGMVSYSRVVQRLMDYYDGTLW
jgi:hypothetical protein